jgi:anti-anti-sigma factor
VELNKYQRSSSLTIIKNSDRSQNMTAPLKIIKPAGILDGVKANELCQQVCKLLAAGDNLVLLDMTDVDSIDSSGLGALTIALKMLRTAGGDLYLCSISAPVQNLLSITRMDCLFRIQIAKGESKIVEVSKIVNPQRPDVRD